MLVFTIAGHKLRLDWMHLLQVLLTGLIVFLVWAATPQAQAVVKIPETVAVAILMLVGMVWRSIFHTDPPGPPLPMAGGGGGAVDLHEAPTVPEVPADRNVRAAMRAMNAAPPPWTHDPRSWERRGIVRSMLMVPALLLVRCLPAAAVPVLQSVAQWLGYVTTFVQGAQALWAVIQPTLGAKGAAANTTVQKALQDITTAQAAIDETLQAAEQAASPTPDVSVLIATVQSAVARAVTLLESFDVSGDAGAMAGSSLSVSHGGTGGHVELVTTETLRHHAGVIQAYKQPRRT